MTRLTETGFFRLSQIVWQPKYNTSNRSDYPPIQK